MNPCLMSGIGYVGFVFLTGLTTVNREAVVGIRDVVGAISEGVQVDESVVVIKP